MWRLGCEIRTDGRLNTRKANRMGSNTELLFEVPEVLQHGQHLESPIVKPKENTHSHVVNAGFHGAIEHGCAPVVVALWPFGVYSSIRRPMVGFLEKLECSDAGLFQSPESFCCLQCEVHVYPADFAGPNPIIIDGLNRIEDVLKSLRVGFSGNHQDALVPL